MKNDIEEALYISCNSEQQLKPVQNERKNDTFFLYFSAFTANLILFSGATDMVWTSPVIAKLESNDTSINPLGRQITYYEISILAGLPAFTSFLGGMVFMRLPDAIGRRKSLMYMAVGMLLSDIVVAVSRHIYLYYVARSMFSLFLGGVFVVLPVYLSEICEDHNRVKFGCLMGMAIPAGNLFSYIVGPLTSVQGFTFLCVAPLIPSLLFFFLVVPETPIYLLLRNDSKGALKVLEQLRGDRGSEEIAADYEELERVIRARTYTQKSGFSCLFETYALKRALLIASAVNLAQHCSGVMAIMSFLEPIFDEAVTNNLSGREVSILVGCVKISVFTVASFSVERFGRRPLLLFSCACSGIPLFILGFCFYWNSYNPTLMADFQWLPIACILTFVIAYAVGLGPIPVALLSDLFPSDVISVAMSFVSNLVGIAIFVVVSLFPIASKYLGVHFCMWVFSINCFLFFCFIYFMLPETKGRSILEVQNMLGQKK
ncbi:unnamed protein product [Phaedon cochleariae]|uniref:Major facilitator superfamily (MFS) profile domain-containing protein n=1 Tax=Phaedon cochleariae TaxID=80249 RepID=A0A9P0DY37_PHACE|nr:unnamed protein product [Phaedon cochleariae]